MYSFAIHDDVEQDLLEIESKDPHCAHFIAALLGEWGNDQDLLDRLSQHRYVKQGGADWAGNINVTKLVEATADGYNLWRVRSYELERDRCNHRIVYMFHPESLTYVVLGVFWKKEIGDYHADGPQLRRVRAAYDAVRTQGIK